MTSSGSGPRSRIVGLEYIPVKDLQVNAKNWRKHPSGQFTAMRAMFEQVGVVAPVIVRKVGNTYELLDGHLRAEVAKEGKLPAVVVDVSDEEADVILATYDPLSALAEMDGEKLNALMQGLGKDYADLANLVFSPSDLFVEPIELPVMPETPLAVIDSRAARPKKITCPHCGHKFIPDSD